MYVSKMTFFNVLTKNCIDLDDYSELQQDRTKNICNVVDNLLYYTNFVYCINMLYYAYSIGKIYLHDFLKFLKRMLHNYLEIMNKCYR